MKSSSIIILNYNGKDLLAQGIPSVIEAVRTAGGEHEIIVVDNASDDGSVQFVQDTFPGVTLLALDKNYRFVGGNNRGILAAKHDIVVLLNNDMVVDKNFLAPLLNGFTDDDVFAVTSQIYFQDIGKRREETGKTGFFWDKGMVYAFHEEVTDTDAERKYVPIVWAGGGSAAYDKKKFMALGLFDELYLPCYVDDLDISYAAWKRGWKSLFCPESIVHHKHRATHDKQYSRAQLDMIILRHQIVFLWKNLTSPGYLLSHLFFLPLHIAKQIIRERKTLLLRAVASAITKIPAVIRSRMFQAPRATVTDRMIFKKNYIRKSLDLKDSRLKILFVCPYVPSMGVHAGGQRMYKIVKGLSEKHEISILSFMERQEEQSHVEDLKTFCERVIVIQRKPNYAAPDLFHIKPHRFVHEFAHPEMKRILEEEVRSGKYDIIQFEYLEMAYLAAGTRQFRVPMILTHHEVQSRNILQSIRNNHMPLLEQMQAYFNWMIVLNWELRMARMFDLVITLTDAERSALLQYAQSLHLTVHNTGVDVKYFSNGNRSTTEKHSMVFVGYYRHSPNADAMSYFCSAILPLILAKMPDAKLYIVGAEPTQAIAKLHDGKSVVVTGRVDDIRPYVEKAAVYIVPMRLGAGIRGKILEAWSMRKAVVSTPIAASGLNIKPGENIIIADEDEKFADKVIELFTDDKMRKTLEENGFRTAAADYDWPRQVEKHDAIYHDVLSGRIS